MNVFEGTINEIKNAPGPCHWCGEWIEEYDLFQRDNFGNIICLECYDFWTKDTKELIEEMSTILI